LDLLELYSEEWNKTVLWRGGAGYLSSFKMGVSSFVLLLLSILCYYSAFCVSYPFVVKQMSCRHVVRVCLQESAKVHRFSHRRCVCGGCQSVSFALAGKSILCGMIIYAYNNIIHRLRSRIRIYYYYYLLLYLFDFCKPRVVSSVHAFKTRYTCPER